MKGQIERKEANGARRREILHGPVARNPFCSFLDEDLLPSSINRGKISQFWGHIVSKFLKMYPLNWLIHPYKRLIHNLRKFAPIIGLFVIFRYSAPIIGLFGSLSRFIFLA